MRSHFERIWYRACAETDNDTIRAKFESLKKGHYYTDKQKAFAFEFIDELGIRATAKMLQIPRRTLQRWCRKYNVPVKRCPGWVYQWAESRRIRKALWLSRGYF